MRRKYSCYAAVVVVSIVLASCASTPPVSYDRVMTLDEWYSEIATMEGLQNWGRIAYQLPDPAGITVSRLTLDEHQTVMDVYAPAELSRGDLRPVIVMARGSRMSEDLSWFGRSALSMEYFVSWAHLLAGHGYIVVAYETEEPSKALNTVNGFLIEHAKAMHIDAERIGYLAGDEHAQLVVQFLAYGDEMAVDRTRCVAFYYPRISLQGHTAFSRLHPVPYFVASAGADCPEDRAMAEKLVECCREADIEVTHTEHPEGTRAFEALHDDARTQQIITETLEFFAEHLEA